MYTPIDARTVWKALLTIAYATAALVSIELCQPRQAAAQRTARTAAVEPRVFGFEIPNGRVRPGERRRLLVRDEAGKQVVARIHVEVGDDVIVMLPDGQLVARHKAVTQGTADPFVAAEKDDIAARMTSEFVGFRTRSTNRFLYVYNTSDAFVTVASRILETMFPGVMAYAQAQKIDAHEPEVPLVVVMFRDEDEFREFTGAPRGVVAFYDIINNRVSMYERSKLDELAPNLAAQELVSTIAHEGAHQILANIGVQQRLSLWPMWLSEGMAEFFAATTTDKRFKWKGAGEPNDMRMFELEVFMARTSFDSGGETFAVTVEAPRLTSTGYASAWSLTHFLATQQREKFHKYVNEVSQLGPLEGSRSADGGPLAANRELFVKHFGDDFGALERQIVKHLNGLPYKRPNGL